MSFTTYWSPNQALIAQVETYTFSAPNAIGNTFSATINGKTITYSSVSGDTAATVVTALLALLQASTIAELQELSFASPTSTTLTATQQTPGTPFANVPGTAAGLVLSTGNGLANGITTTHTTANASPSDINDPQNWLRFNMSTNPPAQSRSMPQNGDDVRVANSTIPMLWNLDQLKTIQFNTYQRWLSMTGTIGLPPTNPNGYTEWRTQYFQFVGPQGSVPAGGLTLLLGYNDGSNATGPQLERYNTLSQQTTLTILSSTRVDFLGIHTNNTFTLLGSGLLNIAANPGEVATLASSTVDGGATLTIGTGVTWTAASTLTLLGGSAVLNAAPATLTMSNASQATITTDQLTWTTITAQGGCTLTFFAGGTITTLTLSQGCNLDKSNDARQLTITNHTLDGDTCQINDQLNSITFTNAGTVKQQVTSGPYLFTGPRTVKVT